MSALIFTSDNGGKKLLNYLKESTSWEKVLILYAMEVSISLQFLKSVPILYYFSLPETLSGEATITIGNVLNLVCYPVSQGNSDFWYIPLAVPL